MKGRQPLDSRRRYGAVKRVFCPHCGQQLQQRTYQEHKRLYYDERNDKWQLPVEPKLPASFELSDVLSQCSEPSSIVELEDDPCPYVQDSPSSCIDQETVKISEPSQASHSCAVAKDSDHSVASLSALKIHEVSLARRAIIYWDTKKGIVWGVYKF